MSLAWGGIVILVLLLPGFLFFVGLYVPEQFTREAAQRSPLGQLAGTLLVATVVHGLSYAILTGLCGPRLPCIDIPALITLIRADAANAADFAIVAGQVEKNRWWIVGYMLLTDTMGTFAGWSAGAASLRLRNRSLSRVLVRHGWVYDVVVGKPDDVTFAHVMTNIKEGERILLYSGFVKTFGLAPDGRFTYLVLHGALRYYMYLEKEGPRTMSMSAWKRIGESTSSVAELLPNSASATKREWSYFVIDGEDIANVMFDRHTLTPAVVKVLPELFREVRASFSRRQVVNASAGTFVPAEITIARGGFVEWQFDGVHNVTFSTQGSPANVPDTANGSVARSFPSVGRFSYRCTIHPGEGGVVNVVAAPETGRPLDFAPGTAKRT
jgi:plastocyanin